MWQPIETAPKDGSTFLAYDPKGFSSEHLYTWPEGHVFHILPCRWKVPDRQTDDGPCWVMALFDLYLGVSDDPCLDHEFAFGNPTHWMPLPEPPAS